MKVVITSANSATGLMLIPVLRAAGHYTIGLVRKPVDIQADEVITDWMNAVQARDALAAADIIVHLSGELNAPNESMYVEANRTTAKIVAESARGGRASRIIYPSYPHASSDAKNYYLRYKGQAEELLSGTGIPVVIFRCPVILDGPDKESKIDVLFRSRKGRPVPVIGSGRKKMSPVYRGTVVQAIMAALQTGRPGIYELSGPEEMTIDAFIRVANNGSVRILHIPGWLAKMLSRVLPSLSSTFVDIMLHYTESRYDPATYREFHIEPVSILTLWAGIAI